VCPSGILRRERNPILDAQIVRNAADLIEKHGSNVWFEKSAAELWSLVKPKAWKGAEAVNKSSDTLDVWIDSGSSSRSVLMRRTELSHSAIRNPQSALDWQADMYFEGSDQHRGWFQSSLLLSLAATVPRRTRRCSPTDSWWMPIVRKFPRANKARRLRKTTDCRSLCEKTRCRHRAPVGFIAGFP